MVEVRGVFKVELILIGTLMEEYWTVFVCLPISRITVELHKLSGEIHVFLSSLCLPLSYSDLMIQSLIDMLEGFQHSPRGWLLFHQYSRRICFKDIPRIFSATIANICEIPFYWSTHLINFCELCLKDLYKIPI